MTKLSNLQIDLLTAAVSDAGAQASAETAKTSASLIKRGLLISVPVTDAPSRLVITTAGRAAIGATDETSSVVAAAEPVVAPHRAGLPEIVNGPKGKLGLLVGLLRRHDGATIGELTTATGWQAHSVRGAIAGAVKKKLGLSVTSVKAEGGERVYRIVEGAGA